MACQSVVSQWQYPSPNKGCAFVSVQRVLWYLLISDCELLWFIHFIGHCCCIRFIFLVLLSLLFPGSSLARPVEMEDLIGMFPIHPSERPIPLAEAVVWKPLVSVKAWHGDCVRCVLLAVLPYLFVYNVCSTSQRCTYLYIVSLVCTALYLVPGVCLSICQRLRPLYPAWPLYFRSVW